jgi:hypothetical protein
MGLLLEAEPVSGVSIEAYGTNNRQVRNLREIDSRFAGGKTNAMSWRKCPKYKQRYNGADCFLWQACVKEAKAKMWHPCRDANLYTQCKAKSVQTPQNGFVFITIDKGVRIRTLAHPLSRVRKVCMAPQGHDQPAGGLKRIWNGLFLTNNSEFYLFLTQD